MIRDTCTAPTPNFKFLLTLGVSYTLMGILYPLRYEQILRKDVLTVPNES